MERKCADQTKTCQRHDRHKCAVHLESVRQNSPPYFSWLYCLLHRKCIQIQDKSTESLQTRGEQCMVLCHSRDAKVEQYVGK